MEEGGPTMIELIVIGRKVLEQSGGGTKGEEQRVFKGKGKDYKAKGY